MASGSAPSTATGGAHAPSAKEAKGAPATRAALVEPLTALALAAATVVLAFIASSGADPSSGVTGGFTWSEILATVLGGGACAAAVALSARGPRWGAATIGLFAAFTALAALSIMWSVEPNWSWYGANQLLCCLAVFAGAAALARAFPDRWRPLVGAVAIAATAISGWALLAKIFPGSLTPATDQQFGRLLEPFRYWNATGLAAAMGLPACLWLADRRDLPRALRALSVTALTVGITVVVLSYSRSAALGAVVGLACSLALGRRRLSLTLMLAVGGVGALPIVLWALHEHSLTSDNISLASQTSAGHGFGIVIVIVLVLVTLAAWVAIRESDRRTLRVGARRRIHQGLAALGGLAVIAVIGALAVSHRGLTGEISHLYNRLTSTTSVVGNTSGRLTQLGSSRPIYWHEGLQVGAHHPLAGAGELAYVVARLRYTNSPYTVHQAHSWLIQTFSDLGLIGLALTLALLVAWILAAARPLALRAAARVPEREAERDGMVALAAIVVCFGVQSTLDWTWYYLGVTLPALACAGWLAGRGPLAAPVGRRPGPAALLDRLGAVAAIIAVVAVVLVGGWLMWAPLRSTQALNDALFNAPTTAAALTDARTAANTDPLSVRPLQTLAGIYESLGDHAAARAQLAQATRRQPENPLPWLWLGQLDLKNGQAKAAVSELSRALALDRSGDPTTAAATAGLTQARAAAAQG